MRSLFSRTFFALVLVGLITVGLLGLRYYLQERDLAVVREAFGGEVSAACIQPPRWMPAWLVMGCDGLLVRLVGDVDERTELCSIVYRVLGGHIDTASIDVTSVPADPGDVLRRLSHVEILWVDAKSPAQATEEDGTRICRALRGMTVVRRLRLDGPKAFTDVSLASLGGHPSIQRLILLDGGITVGSLPTLRSLPSLTNLHVPGSGGSMSQADYRAIRTALRPKVVVIRP